MNLDKKYQLMVLSKIQDRDFVYSENLDERKREMDCIEWATRSGFLFNDTNKYTKIYQLIPPNRLTKKGISYLNNFKFVRNIKYALSTVVVGVVSLKVFYTELMDLLSDIVSQF